MTRILVIDDDRLVRRSVALRLTDAGYATESAGSGEEGLASARKLRPDWVLPDARASSTGPSLRLSCRLRRGICASIPRPIRWLSAARRWNSPQRSTICPNKPRRLLTVRGVGYRLVSGQ